MRTLRAVGNQDLLIPAANAATTAGLSLAVADTTEDLQGIVYGSKPGLALQPPRVEFVTDFERRITWELVLAAPQDMATAAAWDTLDALLSVIGVALGITTADPAVFQPQTGAPCAAYRLTCTTHQTR